MKTLTLALVLLSATVFGQIKYSATTELQNYKTNSTAGASPVGADFGGYTIRCYNTANNLVHTRTGTIISASYFMFKYSDGIGDTSPVLITSFERYGYPKFQWSVRYSDIAGNIPPRTDFTSPSIRCINRADGKVYAMSMGVVFVEYLIVPYTQSCTYVYSDWSECGANGLKTRSVVSQSPEGCTGTPILLSTCTYVPPAVDCYYIYSAWSPCGETGIRTRTVVSKYPHGCTGDPVLTDSCAYVPPTCTYVYSAWGTCQENNTQTRTVISSSPSGCEGTPVLTRSCTYVPPVCTYTYSAWSSCADGMKTRTVTDSVPSGCAGTPVLNELCEPEPCVYTYSAWSACDVTGHRTRTVVSATPNGCTGTPVLSETCIYVPPTCTYTYTEWSACSPSGFRTRSVLSSTPLGCAGTPVIVENCVYTPPPIPSGEHNYYVSNSGNDGYTPTQAHSSATPWRTTAKVNSYAANLLPGDSILFKSGDTFTGTLIVGKSGTLSKPIVFGSYGIGSKPIITGFVTLTGWTNMGGNIWESSATSCKNTLNMVTINGNIATLGRTPNAGSFNTFEAFSGKSQITDNELTNSPNWTGAEIGIRLNQYTATRFPITSHVGSVINYSGNTQGDIRTPYGYFFQNDLRTLDVQGEWFLNKSTKKLSVYSTTNPTTTIKASIYDTLILCNSKNYITFTNLNLIGANEALIDINGSSTGNSIINCDLNYSGTYGIIATAAANIYIGGNTVNHTMLKSILVGGDYALIENNTLKNNGLIIGMGRGTASYTCLELMGNTGNIVRYNSIDSTGYHGLFARGDNALIKNNLIQHFGLTTNDCGGIYAAGDNYANRKLIDNIILYGYGNTQGTPEINTPACHGVYMDQPSAYIYLEGNSIAYCGSGGIRFHNSHDITVRKNTLYGNKTNVYLTKSTTSSAYFRNNRIVSNISFRTPASTYDFYYWAYVADDPTLFGTADSNYYCGSINTGAIMRTVTVGVPNTSYTLAQWQTYSSKDAHSMGKPPITISKVRFEYNATKSPAIIPLDGTYEDVKSNVYVNSITLQPYTSAILFKDASISP